MSLNKTATGVSTPVMETRDMAGPALGYPRDLIGYAVDRLIRNRPGGARIAVRSRSISRPAAAHLLHGDDRSEELPTDTGFPAVLNARSVLVESAFEYGSRRGVWRVLRLFEERKIRVSAFCCVSALPHTQEIASALLEAGTRSFHMPGAGSTTRRCLKRLSASMSAEAVEGVQSLIGGRKIGWMTGRPSPNTRRSVENGGVLYVPRHAE